MLSRRSLVVVPLLFRPSRLFSFFFTKSPIVVHSGNTRRPLLRHRATACLFTKPICTNDSFLCFSLNKVNHCYLSTLSTTATSPTHDSYVSLPTSSTTLSNKAKRKARRESPEGVLREKLNMCSNRGDVVEALRLYDEARQSEVQLSQHHYNVLLYLCSSSDVGLGLERGFEIFQEMLMDKVLPNEATFTSAARIAAAREDPGMAFELVRQMKGFGIAPKLRSYGPALMGFCEKGMADGAYEVDADMIASGVVAEEAELSVILKVSVDAKRADKVYEIMQRLRATVRQVSETTAEIIQNWFKCEEGKKVGEETWDEIKVREAIVRGGGGWHGQGWLGSGEWRVTRTHMDETGVCSFCGEKLVCIDIDPIETQNFASSLTNLACQREVRADFVQFQEWLQHQGPFDAVVDGANLGLINQHSFSFFQLNTVVRRLRQLSPLKRLPLIILHKNRVTGGPAQHPNNKKLLESWKKSGALYATPPGSNDDWYWLYAAVSCKCLLVTNDEMRDHLFQLLGSSFFPRWKEKHQVRLSFSQRGPTLHMPPPYSIVIQESEKGSWHVPTTTGDDIETPRQWLCATRTKGTTLHHL
ncbi:proteinaceous RNase P 1, chloroplastic/mitochondrial-like [Juglans microcarpa x Juglans regia]|uniref:proteinaceous RNase P 1, chloroplastic/mitochondrial-like n=1 Tax=Juglans microcarpa x Juglans regia TaxID=2249226 RepID=UPI001B7DB106|nr:proteinaceous RNase P 1, chloroplastic/mitochondrial-like [Juglans microcarpa x Juglans regia]